MPLDTTHKVTIAESPPSGRPVLARLLQLYLHDFSEFAPPGSPYGEVGEDGLFPAAWLENFWQEEGRVALITRVGARIAGFVLLHHWSALDRPLDHAVAEFFVMRKYRRSGVGTRAAHLAFRRFPGRWEVPVAEYNRPALGFWQSVLAAPGLLPVTEQAGDGRRWSGPVFSFDNRAARSD